MLLIHMVKGSSVSGMIRETSINVMVPGTWAIGTEKTASKSVFRYGLSLVGAPCVQSTFPEDCGSVMPVHRSVPLPHQLTV